MYYHGKGVPVDYLKSFEYSQKAANQGNEAAQVDTGIRLFY